MKKLIGSLIAAVGVTAIVLLALRMEKSSGENTQLPLPTTVASTEPTSAPQSQPALLKTWADVALADKLVSATQPLVVPVTMRDAAKVQTDRPLYVDSRGDLWITHPDAPALTELWKSAAAEQSHVVPHTVRFVHWFVDGKGKFVPALIIADGEHSKLVLPATSQPVHDGDFSRAFSWDHRIVIPTATGVNVIGVNEKSVEQHPVDLKTATSPTGPVQVLRDAAGLFAWIPASTDTGQTSTVARYLDEKWTTPDTAAGWAKRIVQLVPLLDGSIVQLALDDAQSLNVTMIAPDAGSMTSTASGTPTTTLTSQPVDDSPIRLLVAQLSDLDQRVRDRAFDELSRTGPALVPLLEKLKDDQPPEAQLRIEQLLTIKIRPALGAMMLERGEVRAVATLMDGGTVLRCAAGVLLSRGEDQPPQLLAPAYIAFRPGRAAKLLPPMVAARLEEKPSALQAFSDEWILSDDVLGPTRFMGNHFAKLLPKSLRRYSQFVALDRRGRWYFCDPASPAQTLVVDSTYRDETPRLPVWNYVVKNGTVGWTAEHWPCVDRGGSWSLQEKAWVASKSPPITEMPEAPPRDSSTFVPSTVAPSSSAPSTFATSTATAATSQSNEPPILADHDGTEFFGGTDDLRMKQLDGRVIVWPLPGHASGPGPVTLIRAGERRLFLFNSAGRVVRIRQNEPNAPEPFSIEATFTRGIPSEGNVRRIWLDPAGRIVLAMEDQLTILFPTGEVPREIAAMMPTDSGADEDEP